MSCQLKETVALLLKKKENKKQKTGKKKKVVKKEKISPAQDNDEAQEQPWDFEPWEKELSAARDEFYNAQKENKPFETVKQLLGRVHVMEDMHGIQRTPFY